MQLKKLIAR